MSSDVVGRQSAKLLAPSLGGLVYQPARSLKFSDKGMNSTPQCTEDLLATFPGRIAIVGNATPKQDFGELIDSYEAVIRINNFRTAGFEKLVGTKTDCRCTSGWRDIEHRNEHPEFSPFHANAVESSNLPTFNAANARPVLAARMDVHPFIPETSKPSTGLALIQLTTQLGIPVDLFGFDGFKTAHYWQPDTQFHTTHSRSEFNIILSRPNVILFGETYPYAELYNFCHANHGEYDSNVGLKLARYLGRTFRGKTILEFGAGNGDFARHLQAEGNQVVAVEVSAHAFARIQCARKIHGDAFSLAFLKERFDVFASVDVLEHLTENDIRLVLREAGRLADSIFLSVSTRPSGLLGPNGENLHLTVRSADWWMQQVGRYFNVRLSNGYGTGQIVLEGARIASPLVPCFESHGLTGISEDYCIKNGYQARAKPEYFTDSVTERSGCVWQPDVYPLAGILARRLHCHQVIDIGCGRAEKLAGLHPEFQLTGVDYGENIRFCRDHHNFGQWIEADLEKPLNLTLPAHLLSQSLIVCSDVIEHLVNPTALLRSLRRLLEIAPAILLSTPERELVRGKDHLGPPPNQAHVREWSLNELQSLLKQHGCPLNFIGLTRSNTRTNEAKTILAVLTRESATGLLELGKTGDAVILEGNEVRFASSEINATRLQEDVELMVREGKMHASLGNIEAARTCFSRALGITPNHSEARQKLLELTIGAGNAGQTSRPCPDSKAGKSGHGEDACSVQKRGFQLVATNELASSSKKASPPGSNAQAFAHLQRGFDLLKKREFAKAQVECGKYQALIDYDAITRTDNRTEKAPKVSAVIVAYKIGQGLIQCLDSLAASENPPCEIIVVDNGGNEDIAAELARRPILHLRVGYNVILAEGRNIGVHFARAPIISFIDDDAIAAKDYLASVVEAFEAFDIHAFRGKVLPKSDHPNNHRAGHYNLGNLPFPADIDTEGNSAFRADTWRKFNGQDPLLFGGEGVDLSYRMAKELGDLCAIYWPFTVIYHDYANTDNKLETKQSRHVLMRDYSIFKHADLYTFHHRLVEFARSNETKAAGYGLLHRHVKTPTAGSTAGNQKPVLTTRDPLISICIPTYNRAQFIEKAVRSALAQTYSNFEVVVVDDGSTDNTAAIMSEIRDPRVRFILKEHSGGPQTRNRCVAEARGEFFIWLDSDDALLPRTLRAYAEAAAQHPAVDVFYGNLQIADENLNVVEVWSYLDYHGWSEALLSDLIIKNRIPNGFTMIRKSRFEQIGGYDPAFPRAHDYEFWARLAPAATVKRVNTDVGIYRRHEGSLTKVYQQVDTSYEANTVKALLARHELKALFRFCYSAGAPVERGNARAWLIASLLMVNYDDLPAAIEFAKRSVDSAKLGRNSVILDILQTVSGKKGLFSATKEEEKDEFSKLIAMAKKHFAAGQAQPCAQACERMAELRPEATETLLLVGLSLRRWGKPSAANTAFCCLVQRQCETSHLEAVTEAERLRAGGPPSPGNNPGERGLAALLSPFFGGVQIPPEAVEQTLVSVAAAAATDVSQFLKTHREQQTPLFFSLLGLTNDELNQCVDATVAEQIKNVRANLQTPTRVTGHRPAGYSFCIITGGGRRAKLERQIASIRALKLPQFEILVGGDVTDVPDGVQKIDLSQAARAGRLGKMRNALARLAKFDHLVISDDDIVFDEDFGKGLERFGEGYEAMAVSIRNPDGSRFWDWATVGGTKGSVLLDYWDADPNVYITGGICVLKTAVMERVAWDDSRGFYQHEDVDFSARLKTAGIPIRFNTFCKVLHDDDRYSRVDRRVFRFDDLLAHVLACHQSGEREETRRFLAEAVRLAGAYPDRIAKLKEVAARTGEPDRLGQSIAKPAPPSSRGADQQPPPTGGPVKLNWVGSFLDYGSLSHVNRELTQALAGSTKIKLNRVKVGAEVSPAFKDLARELSNSAAPDSAITVRHAWPPDWSRPKKGKLVVVQPWEFGALPEQWVKDLSSVDEAWVPSEYVRRVYVDSGVPASKVFVVPNGVDTKKFNPQAEPMQLPTLKKFKFLFVGGTIFRKGPDVLLKAYLHAFTAADDVCLVIKDFGGKTVYAGQTFEEKIRAAQALPNAPKIFYLNDELAPEALPGLYRACDCLVLPYRGEGYGLPVVEAMACGLPVMTTAGGATDDFVRDEFGFRIPAQRQIFGNEISGLKLVKPGWLLEPDAGVLAERMKWIATHPAEARERGRLASEHAKQFCSWENAAQIALQRIDALTHPRTEVSAPQSTTNKRAPIALPPCALVGHLAEARDFVRQKKFRAAWESTVAAMAKRPFHPEAFLLLAEIAFAVNDGDDAKLCANYARHLAPDFKGAKKFLNQRLKGNNRPEWLKLPMQVHSPQSTVHSRLSVCLIVKNEERFLGQCLKSVREVAQQIVVVDTGSTDRTVEIAKEFGAEVHSFAWCDDFSAARNAALDHVTGDWVLALDADEELSPKDHDKLRQAMTDAATMAWRLPIVDVGRELDGCSYVPRLFRNAPGLFYLGRVHEQIFSSIEVRRAEWGLENKIGDATLIHHGYTQEIVRDRNKIERNLQLLEKAVEELPGEPHLLMNLGLELSRSGRESEAFARYEEAFEALSSKPAAEIVPELRETLLAQYCTRLTAAKRQDETVRVLTSPLARSGSGLTASLHFSLGLAHLELKQFS